MDVQRTLGGLWLLVALASVAPAPPSSGGADDWPVYGGDQGATRYSALADINRANVRDLAVAWTWRPGETKLDQYGTQPGTFQNTPLMIDGVLYVSTPYNRVVALEAATGQERWRYDPEPFTLGQPPNGSGFVHRGVAAWRGESGGFRIFINSRHRLIALDARTGALARDFGDGGIVDLTRGLTWSVDPRHYTNTSPPVVYKDLVILGNGVGDRLVYRNDPRATSVHSTRAAGGLCGRFARFRSRVSSATRPGATSRGASRDTPASGRRCRSTPRAACCICR